MARQQDDDRTLDLFGDGAGHTLTFGKTGAGKTVFTAVHASEVTQRFRARRRIFPQPCEIAVCELCGKQHDGPCEVRE